MVQKINFNELIDNDELTWLFVEEVEERTGLRVGESALLFGLFVEEVVERTGLGVGESEEVEEITGLGVGETTLSFGSFKSKMEMTETVPFLSEYPAHIETPPLPAVGSCSWATYELIIITKNKLLLL